MSTHKLPELAACTALDDTVLALLRDEMRAELQHWPIEIYRAAEEALPDFSIAVRLGEPENIEGVDYPVRRLQADGVFALLDEGNAREQVLALRPRLAAHGAIIALIGNEFDICDLTREDSAACDGKYQGRCAIGVLKGTDVCDFLRVQNTNGANFDLGPEEIIAKLSEWEKLCALHIVGAGWDWLDLTFDTLPDDLMSFAEDVYDFCPDTLDQGYVGPDPHNGKETTEMSEAELLSMLAEISEAIESQTPADLAEFLRREKRLWLWWD